MARIQELEKVSEKSNYPPSVMREINVKTCTLRLYLLNTPSAASVEENLPQILPTCIFTGVN